MHNQSSRRWRTSGSTIPVLPVFIALLFAGGCSDDDPLSPRTASSAAMNSAPPAVEVFVQAHQDDWQLFWGNRAAAAMLTAQKVVFVYTTAGDAGLAQEFRPYWEAREDAARASVDSLLIEGEWNCDYTVVNTHTMWKCVKGNTASYFLRLPDGGPVGNGYGFGSLDQLRAGTISSLRAVDGFTTYYSWNDLTSTLRALLELEGAGQPVTALAVHASEFNGAANSGDHPDHLTTGDLTRAAIHGRDWDRYWYIGYPSLHMPVNLSAAEQAIKWKTIVAYDVVMTATMGETLIGASHAEEWNQRTIFRSELSTGAATPPPPAATPIAVEVYFQAHQDDMSLFWANRTAASIQNSQKVVLVYTTSGDAGLAIDYPPYWHAREEASKAAHDSIMPAGTWNCANANVNGHSILRCVKGTVVTYYMRLPDGNGEGQGYGLGSLNLLRAGSIASLTAVDGSTTFTSWTDLVNTARALITTETVGHSGGAVAIHASEWDWNLNSGDHADHLTTGELAHAATAGQNNNRFWYIGYPTVVEPVNLTPAEYAIKWKSILGYDAVMNALMGETLIGTSSAEEWAWRTIFRTEPSYNLARRRAADVGGLIR